MQEQARAFAIQAHGDQKYGDRPYSFHLDAVASLVQPYGKEAVAIAYLHDTAEDTSVTLLDIEEKFGSMLSACVGFLTDEPGVTRKKRKTETYQKLSKVQGQGEIALIVKTADRLANVRACLQDRTHSLWEMYQEEHPDFRKAIYRAGLCDPLWVELDRMLLPSAYEVFGLYS